MANIDTTWLEKTTFKRPLSSHEQNLLSSNIQVRNYPAGEVLIAEGASNQGVFLLYSGSVSLQYEKHGQAVRIAKLLAGAQLGDMAFFNHDQASATVKAIEACEVYHLSHASMESIMQDCKTLSHDLMLNTIRNLGAALKNMNGFNAYAQQYIQGDMR